jgi:general secretion pathway protein F
MPRWRYQAADAASEMVEGDLDAPDVAGAVERLHAAGLVPLRVRPAAGAIATTAPWRSRAPRRRMPVRSLAAATAQIATLLRAGLPLDEAIEVAAEISEAPRERAALRALLERLRGGSSLADAMTAEGSFPDFAISMVRAGEAGAGLEPALARLTEFLERDQAAREHIKSALLYPAVVALVCCASIGVLFAFVVPRFRPLFEQAGDALPAPARALLAASDLVQAFWWTLPAALVAAVLLVRRELRDRRRRQRWDRLVLRVPLLGPIVVKTQTIHFTRTVGTLLKNGVPLVNALSITRGAVGNTVFGEAADTVLEQVRTGKGLAEPLRATGVFPPLALRLIRIGEESGRQDDMLLRVAEVLEADTRRTIDRLLSLLTPALTIALGMIVAAVIGSILTAVLSVYDLAM